MPLIQNILCTHNAHTPQSFPVKESYIVTEAEAEVRALLTEYVALYIEIRDILILYLYIPDLYVYYVTGATLLTKVAAVTLTLETPRFSNSWL